MGTLLSALGDGLPAGQLSFAQVLARAVLIFFVTLLVVRIGDKRFFAKRTAFDLTLGLVLASMMARAINGPERIVPTIAAGFVLVLLHSFMGKLACRWPRLGGLIKGSSQTLVEDGRVDKSMMRRHHMGDDDLAEELRLHGLADATGVKLARLERNGGVSVIKRP